MKKHVPNVEGGKHPWKSSHTSSVRDMSTFKRNGKAMETFTPLNTFHEHIWRKFLHIHDIHTLPTLKEEVMVHEPGIWSKFHRVKGHHTEDFYQLKKEI